MSGPARLPSGSGHYATSSPSFASASVPSSSAHHYSQWAAGQHKEQHHQSAMPHSQVSCSSYSNSLKHSSAMDPQQRPPANSSYPTMKHNAPQFTSISASQRAHYLPAGSDLQPPQPLFARSSASAKSRKTFGEPCAKKRKMGVYDDVYDPQGFKESLMERSSADVSPGQTAGDTSTDGVSKSNMGDDATGSSHKGDTPKRIKTARACDSCRQKKIRCDVIDDGSSPPGDPNNGNGGLTCAHCRQYGFNCTFFLPITETRFKKKREREAEEAAARHAVIGTYSGRTVDLGPLGGLSRYNSGTVIAPLVSNHLPIVSENVSIVKEWPKVSDSLDRLQFKWDPQPIALNPKSTSNLGQFNPREEDGGGVTSAEMDHGPPHDMRVMGPTSLAYIVHSTAFVPGSAIEAHDLKHCQTFEVGASGDGIIKLNRPRNRISSVSSSDDDEDAAPGIPDAIRGRLAGDVAEKLINSYFEKIGYLFPVVTKSEFLQLSTPPPLLFYAICGVAAMDRSVPREVLSAVRIGLNAIFRNVDILSVSSAITVKALLILSLHGDVHGSTNVQSGSRMWNRLGVGLRMAQDLGLHRDASGQDDVNSFAHYLEQKRRIWGACVTADRLVSIVLGHPLAVDLTDCDVRLPSPYEVTRFPNDLPSLPGEERPFAFNTEMLKLAILFGRVQKTIYSPTGLMKATDEEITDLLSDIDQWREMLPEELLFRGPNSSPSAGILHLAFSCIQMLFFRVFMRISYSCPQHLKFSLTIERMTSLIRWSRESIDWIDESGTLYLDTMQFVSYALVFCATVQYHSWIRRGDEEGLRSLAKLKEVVSRRRIQDEHKPDLSLGAKTAEIIGLLQEAASGQWANTPFTGNLNPTAGVVNRRTADSVRGIIWRNAPGRPGGGAYEASEPHLLLSDLPHGTVILSSNRTPALVRSASGWQQVPGVLQEQAPAPSANGNEGSADSSLPDLSNFTHLGGNVWQDKRGWPVDQRGSGLMVVLPQNVNPGGQQPGLFNYGSDVADDISAVGGPNVNPHLNGLPSSNASDLPASEQTNVSDGTLTAAAASIEGGMPPNAGSIPAVMAAGNASVGAGSGINNNSGYGSLFSSALDPLMLNDPLMGMLDWQAWQSYLAPLSNAHQESSGVAGSASAMSGSCQGDNQGLGNTDPRSGGDPRASVSPRHTKPHSGSANALTSFV